MTLEEALAIIPLRRDALNALDDQLSQAIRQVEHVMYADLKVNLPVEVFYDTEDGRFVLGYGKNHGKWSLTWGSANEDDDTKDIALVSAPRSVRAEVFIKDAAGVAPIEHLVINTAQALLTYAEERGPCIETALRLLKAFEDAGIRALT